VKTDEAKALAKAVKEMSEDHVDMINSLSAAVSSTAAAKKLWKSENKSLLIKAGVALLVFPEPIVSDMLGTALIAAGAVQQGIRRQSIYLDDLPKAFKSVMRSLNSSRELL